MTRSRQDYDILKKEVISLYTSGQKISDIAKQLHVGKGIIGLILQREKLTRKDKFGIDNPNWKGGEIIRNGYFLIYKPDYHRKSWFPYAKRADINLEEKLGRLLLPNEIAHHIDENRLNDHPDNLEPKDETEHVKEHHHKRIERGAYKDSHILQPRGKDGKFNEEDK